MHRFCSRSTLVALLVASAPAAVAQGTGTIAGRITDRATGAPLGDARVIVVGTQRDTRTTEAGQYRLTSLPAGMVRLRVLRLGYAALLDSVQVSAGQEVTLDASLTATVTRLDQVTISATGASERQRETGNSIAALRTESCVVHRVPRVCAASRRSESASARTSGDA